MVRVVLIPAEEESDGEDDRPDEPHLGSRNGAIDRRLIDGCCSPLRGLAAQVRWSLLNGSNGSRQAPVPTPHWAGLIDRTLIDTCCTPLFPHPGNYSRR